MIVKHREGDKLIYLNLCKVSRFESSFENRIRFYFNDDDDKEFVFSSAEERDKSIERIADAYRWQRMMCDLTA